MFENNHNTPNLAGMMGFVVRWGLPDGIGNNTVKSDCYGSLNQSPVFMILSQLLEAGHRIFLGCFYIFGKIPCSRSH